MPAKRAKPQPASDPATDYALGVVGGTIPAGKLVKLACMRHLDDLDRQDAADFPFVWRPDKPERFVKFCLLLRHYKGRFKGAPFQLAPFQQFVAGAVFGWVHKDTGKRRFRTMVVRVPRKNGKTAFAAALALYLLSLDGEPGAEVYFAATKRDQAKLGWSDACTFLKNAHPKMRRNFIQKVSALEFPQADSKMVPLSGDSHTQDGLNPHAAICDELHQWPNRDLWDALEDGMGAREQPLMVDISTAGTDQSSFAYETHKRCEDILSGTLGDDSFFAYVAMADKEDEENYKDPAVWEKANPCLGAVKSYDYMRQQLKAVEATPSKLTTFLTKQLNVWTNAAERWLDPDEWRAGNEALLATLLLGAPCHGALDLGKVSDLSAFALVFRPEDVAKATGGKIRKHALLVWSWCPAEDIVKRSRDDRVPYDAWERAGFVRRMDGNTTDYAQIRADVEQIAKGYQVQDIAFDRMFAGETVQGLQRAGLTMVEFGQGFLSMGGPTAEFERLVKAGGIVHDPNPLLSWQAGNVVCEVDAAANIKPSKKKSREKIDGIVAGIMALGRVMVAKPEVKTPSVWVA